MMAGNIFNYLFQFTMGRVLTTADFGAMNALMALLVISSVPGNVISLTTAKYVSHYRAINQLNKVNDLIRQILSLTIGIAFFFVIVGLLFDKLILRYLNIDNQVSYIILILSAGLMFIVPVFLGIMQGSQKFFSLGLATSGQALLKLGIGIGVSLFGFGLTGATSSLLLSALVILVILSFLNKDYVKNQKTNSKLFTKEILRYTLPTFIAIICYTIMTNIDIVFVKHYFPQHEAGLYATASIIGRTILYFPGAVVMALFPMISEAESLEADTKPLLIKSLVYTACICGIGALILGIEPRLLVKLMFGSKYLESAYLIKYISLVMVPLALINIMMTYSLAKKETKFIYGLIIGCLAEILLILRYHSSMIEILLVLFAVGLLEIIFIFAVIFLTGNKLSFLRTRTINDYK